MKQVYSFGLFFLLSLLSIVSVAQQRYAARVVSFSTEYSPTSWSAAQTLGAPTINGCGDNSNAWASSGSDNRREFLELEYDHPAPINRIFIYETYNPGAVDTVYVFNPNTHAYEKVYEATAAASTPCPRQLTILFPETSFPVSRIRIAINSPAVASYNEIDAVGIGFVSQGGTIGTSQNVCATTQAAAFTSSDPAFNGNAGVVYQWQDSTENGAWTDIAAANAITYQAPLVLETTWYRRKATLNSDIVYSNVVRLSFFSPTDPSVFPVNSWNFYTYGGSSIDLSSAVYKGLYNLSSINFDTRTQWPANGTPATAAGYQGCALVNGQFVVAARRKGFPADNYLAQVKNFRGALRFILNGVQLADLPFGFGTLSLGALDQNSELEIRLLDNSGEAYIDVDFVAGALSGGDIGDPQNICSNDLPAALQNYTAAFGGAAPASITYQWQDSVVNGNWQNISTATGLTFQPGALNETTWYRRMAKDNTNATAYSDEVKIDVSTFQGDTSVYGNQSWNLYAFSGNNMSLNGVGYRGYYTVNGLAFTTNDHWHPEQSPASAASYLGCPVPPDNFVLSARRQGFTAGNYRLHISEADEHVIVLVNGVEKYNGICCVNFELGALDANSKVEIRNRETGYVSRLKVEFVRTDLSSIYDYPGSNTCISNFMTGIIGNNWIDFTDAGGRLIASINPNGNNLGTVTLNVSHAGTSLLDIPTNPINNKRYLPRYFNVTSSNYPSGNFPTPVGLRFYYRNSELENYKAVTSQPALRKEDLRITHYNGTAEDCLMGNNANEGEMLGTPVVADFTATGFYLQATTNSFSEFGAVGGNQTLPVTLTQFKASLVNGSVQLNWTTGQELDNKGFEVLRSKDGRNFEKIGWIEGNGTSNIQHRYSFIDATPLAGRSFYRLRQLDIDGNTSFSEIAGVTTKEILTFSINPNPVKNILYLEVDEKKVTSVRITDLQGRVIWQRNGRPASSVMSIPVQQLGKGIYLLEISTEQGNRQTGRFIKK